VLLDAKLKVKRCQPAVPKVTSSDDLPMTNVKNEIASLRHAHKTASSEQITEIPVDSMDDDGDYCNLATLEEGPWHTQDLDRQLPSFTGPGDDAAPNGAPLLPAISVTAGNKITKLQRKAISNASRKGLPKHLKASPYAAGNLKRLAYSEPVQENRDFPPAIVVSSSRYVGTHS
jgi:hypothetical protein